MALLDFDADGLLDIAGLATDGTLALQRGTETGFATMQKIVRPPVAGMYRRWS